MRGPLVSIAVVTYNSSKTVIDTLDSIYNQTYQNIELIISDDCSKDDTISLCRQWIDTHKMRFKRAELLTVAKNTGVSANFNRADKACHGEWIKPIAGDDMLMPNCVQTYIDYIAEHPDAAYIFARCKVFGGNEEMRLQVEEQFAYDFFELSPQQQYDQLILKGNCLPATTPFYNKKTIADLGVEYDERIPLLEDWPRWINLIKAGVHFDFIDKETVLYRISEGALSTNFNSFSEPYRKSSALCCLYYIYPERIKRRYKLKETYYGYLRARKTLSNHKLWWGIICKAYKILIIHRI